MAREAADEEGAEVPAGTTTMGGKIPRVRNHWLVRPAFVPLLLFLASRIFSHPYFAPPAPSYPVVMCILSQIDSA